MKKKLFASILIMLLVGACKRDNDPLVPINNNSDSSISNQQVQQQSASQEEKAIHTTLNSEFRKLCLQEKFDLFNSTNESDLNTMDVIRERLDIDHRDSCFKQAEVLFNTEELDISDTRVRSIRALKGLPNLKRLYILGSNISDLSALSSSINLENLDVRGNVGLESLKGIENATNLKELLISNTGITDISVIENFKSLEYFEAASIINSNDESLSDISALNEIENLEVINLEENKISDISALARHSKLKTIILSNNSIKDITVINQMNLDDVFIIKLNNNEIDFNQVQDFSEKSNFNSNYEISNQILD